MAVMFCWKTGLLNISPTKALPDGTIEVAHGLDAHLRSEMLATAVHDISNHTWYVPGVRELGDDDNDTIEQAKFKRVQDYANKLERRKKK